MSDLALRQDTTPTPYQLPGSAGALVQWAESASAAYELARRLSTTAFCPAQYKAKPDEAAAAMLAGAEVGLSPMAALRAFDIIQGIAAPRAITLRAILQSMGHKIRYPTMTPTRVVAQGLRRGEQEWQSVEWTIKRAQDLGLAGKEQWKKQPQTMLIARATGELARLIAADAILGIPYTAEEIVDAEPEPTTTVTRLPTTSRTVRRNAPVEPAEPPLESIPVPTGQAAAQQERVRFTTAEGRRLEPAPEPGFDQTEPEPAFDQSEPVDVTGMEAVELIRPQQSRKMMALFNEHGFKNRDDRLDYVRDIIGIDIASSKDLTVGDASKVIEALVNLDAPTPDSTP